MGTGTAPKPPSPTLGTPWDGGCQLLLPPCLALFPLGRVPTRPIFMGAPSLPGGLLIPPETGQGLLTELPHPLNKQAWAPQLLPD